MRSIITTIALLFTGFFVLAQSQEPALKITHLTDKFYLYTTYNFYKGDKIPSVGMYCVTNAGVVLMDTPWDTTQYQPLLDSIRCKHNKNVIICIATHFHEDRTGGLAYYKKRGIKTYTSWRTDTLSKKRGMKRSEYLLPDDTVFTAGQYSFQIYYPGKGHAPDNIVIWIKNKKILYAGCLIKSIDDETLGNLGDASIPDYATTIENIKQRFTHAKYVITGHSDLVSPASITHTLSLARDIKKKNGG